MKNMCYTVSLFPLMKDVTSKYQPLTDHLRRSGEAAVPMTFEDVERVIGAKLPASAGTRPWWSNNPTNNVMTKAWRAAGYESTRVDMTSRTLVFRRVTPRGGRGGVGPAPSHRGAPRRTKDSDWFTGFYGGLRGTVTIAPGADLTAPSGEAWDAERRR